MLLPTYEQQLKMLAMLQGKVTILTPLEEVDPAKGRAIHPAECFEGWKWGGFLRSEDSDWLLKISAQ